MSILTIDVEQGNLCLRFPYHPALLEAIKDMPSREWDKTYRVHWIGRYDVDATIAAARKLGWEVNITPSANEIISEHVNLMERIKKIKKGEIFISDEEIQFKLPLRQFQKVGAQFLKDTKKCLLSDEMGTGKTAQMIAAYKVIKGNTSMKILILCPGSVKGAWASDITKFTDLNYLVIEGTHSKRMKQYDGFNAGLYDIMIMSYETFTIDFGDSDKNYDEFGIRRPDRPVIMLPQIDILCADECHRLVKSKNKITRAISHMVKSLNLQYVYLLTGTPIVNRVEDIWSLMQFIEPEVVGKKYNFENRYCVIEYKELEMLDKRLLKLTPKVYKRIKVNIPNIVGYKNLDELKVKLEPYYIRREKKDVLQDLPDKTYEHRDIELTTTQKKLYATVKEMFLGEFSDKDITGANALVWFTRARQIADSSELALSWDHDFKQKVFDATRLTDKDLQGNSAKMDELLEILAELIGENEQEIARNDKKVVIFSQFREMTDILVNALALYKPLYLHGGVKMEDRPLIIKAFQEDPQYRIFVSTLKAGGVGITLTAADTVILFDSWFSPATNDQAIDRCHRIGQKNNVTIINLQCMNTLEERVEQIIEKKRQMFIGLFGEDTEVLARLSPKELKELI